MLPGIVLPAILLISPLAIAIHQEPDDSARAAAKKAASAAEEMDAAYSNVRMAVRITDYNEKTGAINFVTENEFLRSGERIVARTTVVESHVDHMKQGETRVYGGWPQKRFTIRKDGEDSGYAIDAFGSSTTFEMTTSELARPVLTPYQIYDFRLADFLRHEGVSPMSVASSTFGGRAATELVVDYKFIDEDSKLPGRARYLLYFVPDTWTFLGFTRLIPDKPNAASVHFRISYEPESGWPPRMSGLDVGGDHPERGETLARSHEVLSLTFETIDQSEFTVAAFGLEEPVNPVASLPVVAEQGWPWLWILVGLGLTASGVLFVVMARRRKAA